MNFQFVSLPEMTTAMAYGSQKGPTLDDLKKAYGDHNQVTSMEYYYTLMSISKNGNTETLVVAYILMEPNHTLPNGFQKLVIKAGEYVKAEVPKENFEEVIKSNKNELDAFVKSHGKGITMTNIFFLFEDDDQSINVYFPVK